ncbi:MEDS domain-containing protein [Nonomuraea sp. NPDC002799]
MRQVKDVQLGDHLCLAFTHEAEQREVAAAFITAGLERGERVLYVTDGRATERVRAWLSAAGVDAAAVMAAGQFGVHSAQDGYLSAGRFDPDEMIKALRTEVDASLKAGFSGFRVSGEMSWALAEASGAERLEDFERRVTALFQEGLSAAICQYDMRLFRPDHLADLVGCHSGRVQMNAIFQQGSLHVLPAFDADGALVLQVIGEIDRTTAGTWSAVLETAGEGDGDVRMDLVFRPREANCSNGRW